MQCFRGGRVYSYDLQTKEFRQKSGFVVDGGSIVSLDPDAGSAESTVELDGRTVLPAFADCHLHLTDSGYFIGSRDFSSVRTYDEFGEALARLAGGDEYVLAGNYDDALWDDGKSADAIALEAHHGHRYAMVTRVDGHSCIVNRRTLAWLELHSAVRGIERDELDEPTGRLFLEANMLAQARFLETIPRAQRREAERRAVELALSRGALHLHAQLVGFATREAYAAELESLPTLGPAKFYPKICEPDPQLAAAFGLPFVGGDVFLDGSLGSGTAALSEPYCDRSGNGTLRLSDGEVFDYFAAAESAAIAAGVHAIGDRAIEQCLVAWERVLDGKRSENRHFIEHFELASTSQIERAAALGLYLSMQPQFDRTWGGADGMYERRLGARAKGMNALASALRAGAVVCGGDDSPVCALSPLQGMHAAVHHHNQQEALTPAQALTMYTYDAARLGFAEQKTGRIAPGMAADFVVVEGDPLEDGDFAGCAVLQTWSDGRLCFDAAVK